MQAGKMIIEVSQEELQTIVVALACLDEEDWSDDSINLFNRLNAMLPDELEVAP